LNEQVKALDSEIKRISMAILELTTAYATLENLKEGEALIPIGGSSFLFGDVKADVVLIPIGSGYFVAKQPDKAKDEIKKRMEKMDEAVKKLEEEKEKLLNRVYELARNLNGEKDVPTIEGKD
jgi:prefoldin alpha subunit